jgi:hypothetical protein
MSSSGANGGRLPRMQLGVVAAMLFLASAYFYQDPEWNGNSRLDLTKAIVEQGTFRIDAYHLLPNWGTEDKAYYNGHYYSDKAIGPSLLAVPIYFTMYKLSTAFGITLGSELVKHVLTTTVLGAAFTISGVAIYLIALQLTGNALRALVLTLALSFGTMLWPYSAVFYGHVLAAAFLALAFWLELSTEDSTASVSYSRWFWTGLAIGLAFIADYTAAFIIAGLLAYALYVLWNRRVPAILRAGLAGATGALIPVSINLVYNFMVFGNPFTAGYAYEAEDQFRAIMSLGLMGMRLPDLTNTYHITFDPQFGVFWQSPLLVLASIGFFFALKASRHRAKALLCLYAVGVMVAMNGASYLWYGGSAFGPRLLIPALPFFIVPLALLPPAVTWLTGFLGFLSAGQMLIPLLGQIQPPLVYRIHRNMFYVADAPFRGFSLMYDYGLPQILRRFASGTPSWTLGAAVGLPYWLSIPALVVMEAALVLMFRRRIGDDGSRPDRSLSPSETVARDAAHGPANRGDS